PRQDAEQLPDRQSLRMTRTVGLGAPCSPCGPGGPAGPTGPGGPAAPGSPFGPCGPGGPGSPFGPCPQPASNASNAAATIKRPLRILPTLVLCLDRAKAAYLRVQKITR